MLLKFCKDCLYSRPNKQSSWELNCVNPRVNAKNEWALGCSSPGNGVSCREERGKKWFAPCGMKGKQWIFDESEV